jgi:hypothetical protein
MYGNADIHGQAARGDFSTGHGSDQLLLCSLWVFDLKGQNLDRRTSALLFKQGNRIRLIRLYTDHHPLGAKNILQQCNALQNALRLFNIMR